MAVRARVLAAGKLRDAGLTQLCERYVKRARPLGMTIELLERRDTTALRKQLHAGGRDKDRALTVVLDERGEQLTTLALSRWFEQARERGLGVTLYIGDAHGFDDADRAAADRVLGLSRLTLPHRLARVLLVEQLYRVATVMAGHPYHHDG